jgi:hypothetical protein
MKSAPNKLLKTNGRISDIMDYPNKVLEEGELTENSLLIYENKRDTAISGPKKPQRPRKVFHSPINY